MMIEFNTADLSDIELLKVCLSFAVLSMEDNSKDCSKPFIDKINILTVDICCELEDRGRKDLVNSMFEVIEMMGIVSDVTNKIKQDIINKLRERGGL